jgi:hypothetical protein
MNLHANAADLTTFDRASRSSAHYRFGRWNRLGIGHPAMVSRLHGHYPEDARFPCAMIAS